MKKLILTTVLVAFATALYAQSDNIAATATVQSPITVSGDNDLEFGTVFPGVNKSVARTAAEAGAFSVTGQNSATVYLNFTLPTNLEFGANNLPISFSATDAGSNTADDQGAAVAFNPATADYERTLSAGGELYVWIGGTVQPTITQVAGAYSADITLTVTYD